MTTKTKKYIELAERAKCVEGSEKWPVKLVETKRGLRLSTRTPIYTSWLCYGRLLPHNPQDPMNPADCLERAKAYVSQWHDGYRMAKVEQSLCVYAPEQADARVIFKEWPTMPTYEDYMEALLNLHDLAKSEGGEWAKAWERAMNPEEGE